MPSAIAAFPWVQCSELLEIGSVQILPYERGQLPGDLPAARQSDIDAIFGAYAERPGISVDSAALLQVGNWNTGMDVAPADLRRLFQARDAIAFSALSKRRLFRQHFDYCNSHNYTLVVQRYLPGQAERFSFDTRRRDGGANHMWSSDMFAFQRPIHVPRSRCELDGPLLQALLNTPEDSALREAIGEFNSANTDSNDVPEHVEIVMVKSAFEWLLGIDEKAISLVRALTQILADVLAPAPPFEGAMGRRWRGRWQEAQRPLEAWARDFCVARNTSAHGSRNSGARPIWLERTHLAFTAIFMPLLVKKRLADDGLLTLGDIDREQLQHIEQLLLIDPFTPEVNDRVNRLSHPWAETYYEALFNNLARRLARERGSALPPEAQE